MDHTISIYSVKIYFIVCYPGQITFDRHRFQYDYEHYYISGYPTVCHDGALAPICDTTDLDDLDISAICLYTAGVIGKLYTPCRYMYIELLLHYTF